MPEIRDRRPRLLRARPLGFAQAAEALRDRLGLNRARLYILARHFRNHGTRTLLLGKFTQAFGAPVLIAAGLGKLPIWKFTWVNFLATIPKSLVFVAIGYTIGAAYSRIDHWMGRASLLVIALVLVAAGLWLLSRWARK